jgi:hypothetical protein
MNNIRLEKEGKRVGVEVIIDLFDDWIDGNSIGHDHLIYIEGVILSQYETSPRLIFQVFHVFGIVQTGIQKTRSGLGFLSGHRKS